MNLRVNRPTPEQLALLRPLERFWFTVIDWLLRYFMAPLILWNRINMVHFAKLMNGPRWRTHGLEHLEALTDQDRLVIASNHRSFFDFYVIGPILYTQTRLSKRILFPVRSPFFYDSWIGGLVNGWMSGFFMFPPILRDPKRRAFNTYALQRISDELKHPGQLIGMHPEGTRGKGPDPYSFLRAQPGVGAIVLSSADTRILPVFVIGLSNSMKTEFGRTWFSKEDHPIDVLFGPVIDVEELRVQGNRLSLQIEVAHRTMTAIGELAEQHRASTLGEE